MHWNYRIMRRTEGDDITFEVHEVYYDENRTVTNWTEDVAGVVADDAGGIVEVLGMMARAARLPVLDVETGAEIAGPVSAEAMAGGNVIALRRHGLERGDVVRSRPNGPHMLVAVADGEIEDKVQCLWFDGPPGGSRLIERSFSAKELTRVYPPETNSQPGRSR